MKKSVTVKVLSVVLAVCLLVSCTSVVFAAEMTSVDVDVTIVSYGDSFLSSGSGMLGHSFLYVKNNSVFSVTIGHMSVSPGGQVTVGCFGNRSAHSGIWYNIEAAHWSSFSGVSYSAMTYKLITATELATLNSKVNSLDYYNVLTNNCATVARKCWNSFAPSTKQLSGNTPAALKNSIISHGGTTLSLPSTSVSTSLIAYQTEYSVFYDPSGY